MDAANFPYTNTTGLAAWSAILDGVVAVQNQKVGTSWVQVPATIDPSTGPNRNKILQIVNAINTQRAKMPNGVFTSVGQILSVPELTVSSPYLTTNVAPGVATPTANGISDAMYERIPQQIMSLVRLGSPRYVIFAYGQSLKPADHSIVQSGQFFGMCTNYQITGEVATRTVLRVDNAPFPGRPPTKPRVVVESFNVLGPE